MSCNIQISARDGGGRELDGANYNFEIQILAGEGNDHDFDRQQCQRARSKLEDRSIFQ